MICIADALVMDGWMDGWMDAKRMAWNLRRMPISFFPEYFWEGARPRRIPEWIGMQSTLDLLQSMRIIVSSGTGR